jgi:hypothetical protein
MSARARSEGGSAPPSRDLHRQLARERARNAGLERGLSTLHQRVKDLHAENAQLRAALAT